MLRKLIVSLTAAPLMMGCAVFAQAQDLNHMSAPQKEMISATCTQVMGLRQGEFYFNECQDSLAHTLAMRDAAYANMSAEDSCRAGGLAPGSAALATCMLDRQSGAHAPFAPGKIAVSDTIQPGKSYYNVSPTVQFERKRYACAQLGLTPGSGIFGECVTGLVGALMPNPS